MQELIVLAMPLHNAEDTVSVAIESFLDQQKLKRKKKLLIANDSSIDKSVDLVKKYLPHAEIELLHVNFKAPYATRNYLNKYIRNNYPEAILIGRLDADDTLTDKHVLLRIEKIFDTYNFDVLLAGNHQQKGGVNLPWINKADRRFLDNNYLLERLHQMASGIPQSELPYCNILIKPSVKIDYPPVDSAEDHWFLVQLLLQKNQLKIHIDENLIYCTYSINGLSTRKNQQQNKYLESRRKLYHFFKSWIEKTKG